MKPARTFPVAAMVLLTAVLVLAGCTATGLSPTLGTVGVMLEIPSIIIPIGGSPVDVVVLRLEAAGGGVSMEYELDVVDNRASANVDINPGTWTLEAEVYLADETLVATGDGMAVVLPGTITEVNMHLSIVSGGLDIDIDWDDAPPLLVADVSHRPVWVEIEGVGQYVASGLSRIGWDIQVFEYPSNNGRTIKEPGVVSYPDLAMLYLRSSEGEVNTLAAWTADPEPRSMSIILEGLSGETMRLNFFGVVPVSANTDTFPVGYEGDVQMGGVKLRYDRIELSDYTLMFREIPPDWWLPNPGQTVEFEGVDMRPGYEIGVLDVPEPGSNPALWFSNLYPGSTAFNWAEEALDVLEAYNSVMRRSVSIINIGPDGMEINRINIFETWPASINLFNPEKLYGQTNLVDIYLVGEKVEEG